jgi:hypothetical protein
MTFAELVIKFEVQGDSSTKTTIRAVEAELKNVSNASVNAANKFSSSMTKISQSSRGLQNFQNLGQSIIAQFGQAAGATVPFSNNLVDIAQSMILLGSKVNLVSAFFGVLQRAAVGFFNHVILLPLNLTKAFGGLVAKIIPTIYAFVTQTNVSNKLKNALLSLGIAIFKITVPIFNFGIKFSAVMEAIRKSVSNTFSPMITSIGQTIAKFSGLISFLGNTASAFLGLTASMAIFTAAVLAMDLVIAKTTIEAAFAFEELQARLSALKGPAKANDILDFVRQLAEPSNFTTDQLANSAVQLEAFGLNAKRILPTIAQLGMAFGADAEKLRLLTDMFGRLSQGQLPDVQVMAQFGLSKSKLMKEGIKFDNQGSLVSSTREVFIAIEKIVNRDYGKIFDQMAKTGNARLASLTDVFERLKIQIGMQLSESAKIAISGFADALGALEKSGVLEQAARTMLLPFEALGKVLTGGGGAGGFSAFQIQIASFFGAFIAGFEEVNIQTALFIERMNLIGKLIADFATMNPAKAVENFSKLGKNLTGSFSGTRMGKRGDEIAFDVLAQMNQPGTNIKDLIDNSKLIDFGKLEDLLKPDKSDKDKNQRTLDLIQQNTKTQNELTLRNMTYGGGELAAQGISAVQMGGFRSVSSPQINASNDIVRGVEKIVRGYSNSNNLNFSFRRS